MADRAGDRARRRVTSADVARMAGVSRATVSYVLNDTPHQTISAATRSRVRAAAEALGYAPSAAARALRTGRSDVVLCLLPDWPIGSGMGALLGNLSTALARHGLTFVAHPGSREDRPIAHIWKALSPAAVLAFTDFSDDEIDAMRAAGVALVVADLAVIGVDDIPAARLADPPLSTVTTDQAAVAAHLAETVVAVIDGRPVPEPTLADAVRVVCRPSTSP
jgi:DNA-binding LacI/PurR family transcriptional regulator